MKPGREGKKNDNNQMDKMHVFFLDNQQRTAS